MKIGCKKTFSFINKRYFYIFAVLALLIPDLQLRYLVWPKVYDPLFATVIPALFNLAWISLFLYGSLVLFPKKWGRIIYILIGAFFIILSFSQYVYFGIFNQFFRLNSIGLAGEGGDYLSYAFTHIDIRLIVCSLLSILFLIITAIRWRRPDHTGKTAKYMTVIPVLVLVGLHIFMQPALFNETDQDWDSWSKPRVVYSKFNDTNKSLDIVGIYHFVARDFYKTWLVKTDYTEKAFKIVDEYIAERQALDTDNKYTGLLEGKNVIAIMLEGIDDWMITDKYTPVMKYMMKNGINLANHYAPVFGTGYTLGSEFCFNTGFYTPPSDVSAVNYASNRYPYALPHLFANKGYSVNSFHYNHSEFYNRGLLHNNLGYEKYNSFQDYGMLEYESQSDSKVLQVEDIYRDITKDAPFFSFIITYSGHIPYTFDDAKLSLAKANHPELMDETMDLEENACRLLARDTDDFFRQLLERLNAEGLLENTVIVVYTDHYAYGYSDQNKLKQLNKDVGDDLMLRVPAFIYSPSLEPVEIKGPTHTADLLPTLVNMFNLEDNHCYLGSDILDDNHESFVYFEGSDWMDDTIYYTPANPESNPEMAGRIKEGKAKLRKRFEINDIVIIGNYFAHRK